MIDASIPLGVKPVAVESPMNMLSQALQIKAAQNQDALAQYSLSKAQRSDQEASAVADLVRSGVDLSTPEGQAKLYGAAPLTGASFVKQQLENQNIQSQMQERQANAKAKAFEQAQKGYGLFQQTVGSHINNPNATPQDVANSVQSLVQSGVMEPKVAQGLLQGIPQDPAQLHGYLRQVVSAQMTPEQLLTVFAPKATEFTNGQVKGYRDTNPNSPTYGQLTAGAPVQMQADPNAVLSAQTSRANNSASIAAENQRSANTIAAENLRAGVVPGGGLDPNGERTAQAIASGQLPPPSGMALTNPRNQRILGRVMEINPNYDFTSVTAKKKAASDFTTGSLGNSMRSFQVAGQHLDQLGQLVDALGNGNLTLVNKLGNAIGSQTGNPAPTNFDAAKDVVSKEVVKAIVAGGGGVSERQELAHLMDNAESPAQLKGVIQQYRNLMAAQHDALLQQRRAAGLPDSTLPNYTEAAGGAPANGGWQYLGVQK